MHDTSQILEEKSIGVCVCGFGGGEIIIVQILEKSYLEWVYDKTTILPELNSGTFIYALNIQLNSTGLVYSLLRAHAIAITAFIIIIFSALHRNSRVHRRRIQDDPRVLGFSHAFDIILFVSRIQLVVV